MLAPPDPTPKDDDGDVMLLLVVIVVEEKKEPDVGESAGDRVPVPEVHEPEDDDSLLSGRESTALLPLVVPPVVVMLLLPLPVFCGGDAQGDMFASFDEARGFPLVDNGGSDNGKTVLA